MINLLVWRFAAVLLIAINCACFYQQRVMPPSELPLDYSGRIEILTKDGTRYRLEDAVLGFNDVSGYGWKFPVDGQASTFSGSVSCSDIVLVQTERPQVVASLLAWGTIGVVAGQMLAASGGTPTLRQEIEYPGGGGGGSCPYVYSFDGTEYHLESETFAGAVCPELERTVVDPLRHLAPVDGKYLLAIVNQSPESQHSNVLNLISVEHPSGTLVVPDSWGRLHTIVAAESPLTAIDRAGRDVGSLLAAVDSQVWGSDLSDTNLIRQNAYSDGLVCTFRRPAGSQSTKLVLYARNSSLGFFALGKMFALQGPRKLDWYHELGHSQGALGKLTGWIRREGGMKISVRTQAGWEEQAWIPDVGPQVEAERTILLDCSSCTDSLVQIQIESAAGLWLVDRLGIDWSEDTPLVINNLKLLTATNQDGLDVARLLKDNDSLYYATMPGNFAVLSYEAPAPTVGSEQTILLSSRGHYYSWIAPDAVVSVELFESIIEKPGLGSQLYWHEWYQAREYWDSFYNNQPTFGGQIGRPIRSSVE